MYKALKLSPAVTEKINGIYNNPRAPDSAKKIFPRITMFEIGRSDADAADDAAFFDETIIRIDIWSKINNLYELSAEVKRAIEKNFELCRVDLQADMYESDTNIYHKPINVKIKMEV